MGRPNAYAAAGGPDLDGVFAAIAATFARFDVAAAALTAYDPHLEDNGTIAAAARAIGRQIATRAAVQR